MKDFKDMKFSMDNVFMMLWVVVILAVMLVTLLGQFLTTLLIGVAIVAYINKMSKVTDIKK